MLACEGGRRNSTILDLDSLDSTRFSEVAESKDLPESSNTSSTGYKQFVLLSETVTIVEGRSAPLPS